jgi:hypothetical protein
MKGESLQYWKACVKLGNDESLHTRTVTPLIGMGRLEDSVKRSGIKKNHRFSDWISQSQVYCIFGKFSRAFSALSSSNDKERPEFY